MENFMIKLDGYDAAIIGPAVILLENKTVQRLVYDAEGIRKILMERDGMEFEEAREFIEFNIEAAYMGSGTPVLVWPNDLWDEESWSE
jgi:hypothetical protein